MAGDSDEEIAALKARLASLESQKSPATPKPRSGCLVALLVLVALIAVASMLPQPEETPEEKAERAQQSEDWSMIGAAEDAIRASLKDPDSARFEDVQVGRKSGLPIVCGYYNAKNGFGGYVGRQPFMSTKDTVMFPSTIGRKAFVKMWNESCPTVG